VPDNDSGNKLIRWTSSNPALLLIFWAIQHLEYGDLCLVRAVNGVSQDAR
jgi:hypothetical protein